MATDDESQLSHLDVLRRRLATAEGRSRHGLSRPVETVEGREVQRHWPELRGDLTALFIAEVGRVDGAAFAAQLLRAASRIGREAESGGSVEVIEDRAVIATNGTRRRVHVADGPIEGGALMIATGSWANTQLDAVGIDHRITPTRGQIVHLRLEHQTAGHRPVVNTLGSGYLLGFDDRVVVGATHEQAGFAAVVTAAGQHAVLDQALSMAPGLAAARLLETRVGLRPTSADGLPLIGAVDAEVFVAVGLGSWGLTLGPYLGGAVARQALGAGLPPALHFLAPHRSITEPVPL